MPVTAADVAALLGQGDDADLVTLAGTVLPVVTAQVRAYTRDRGFTREQGNPGFGQPCPDLEAVILTSAARLAANPENLRGESIGDYSVQRQVIDGWTLPELAILNRYRRRAR